MFGGNGNNVADSKAMKIVRKRRLLVRIDFVSSDEKWFSCFSQQPCQFEVRRSQLTARIYYHDSCVSLAQRNPRLTKNF